jgi:putative ABC transport system permease protein
MALFSTLRVAIRTLARRPAITVIAVLSLAVGIGVNTAVFSLVDLLFLRPPAVHDPYSLVDVRGWFKDSGSAILDWSDCQDIANQTPAFSEATAYMRRGGLWREGGGDVTLLLVTVFADNYFDVLGVRPALGRLPAKNHDYSADPEPPIVLANWFWRDRMGARRDIIGSTMELTGKLFRVAAVLPAEFRGLEPMDSQHIWMPVGSWTRNAPNDLNRGGGQFEALARLRAGATIEQAQAQLDTLARRIEASDSRVAKGRRLVAASLGRQLQSRVFPGVLVLAVVALVLLVACANVAIALLAYAEARRREIALRLALGAGRVALLTQFAAESAVLACVGAGAGLLLGTWLMSLAPVLAPPTSIPISFDLRTDVRLLAFTAAATLVTLAVFGLAPLAYSLRVSLLDAMSGSRTTGRAGGSWTRTAFVSAQVALSVIVVSGAVVLLRALADARTIYPGYDTNRPLALVWANKSRGAVAEPAAYDAAAGRMSAVGGVEAVTYARHLPLVGSGAGATVSVVPQGAAPDAVPHRVYFNLVGPRFFEVTGARILRGRPFADFDHHSGTSVAIVNSEAARRFWPGEDPLGKTLRVRDGTYQVVGIAADGRIGSLHGSVDPVLLLPASAMQWGETILIASTKADPSLVVRELAKAAGSSGDLRVYQSMTLHTLMRQALYDDWIPTILGGALAIVGLLLAAGGLYGAVSYAAQRRLPEFGVRMAIGARPRQIGGLVIRQGALLCLIGVPLGAALFAAIYRYYGATLLRGRPLDPAALAAGAAVTIVVVLAGAALPAIRAARLDPSEILRAE